MVGDQVDIGAPVNEWDVIAKGFATVHDCEQYQANARAYGNLTEVLGNPKELALMKAFPQRRAGGRCTPDDDQRLKSK
jgi:hypothetical protein